MRAALLNLPIDVYKPSTITNDYGEEVIEYVKNRYGKDHVGHIITYGTLKAKQVLRDVGRALDMPYSDVDKIAKMLPNEIHMTIDKALEQNRELKQLYDEDETTRKLLDISISLEGMPKNASTHACGVVITKNPVDTYVPLYINDGNAVSLPLGLNFGWCGELNLQNTLNALFDGDFGSGYPEKDAERKRRDTALLKEIKNLSSISFDELLGKLDKNMVEKAEKFLSNCKMR